MKNTCPRCKKALVQLSNVYETTYTCGTCGTTTNSDECNRVARTGKACKEPHS